MSKRLVLVVLVLLTSLLLLAAPLFGNGAKKAGLYLADRGRLDLSGWNPVQDGVVWLDGEWAFYWNRLLVPTELAGEEQLPDLWMKVPQQWSKARLDGRKLPAHGAATYRLQIHNLPEGTYGLKKSSIRFSSQIFVNGQLLMEDGSPALDRKAYNPGNNSGVVYFSSRNGLADIVIQVANYDYLDSGIVLPLVLGNQGEISKLQQRTGMMEFSIVMSFATIAVVLMVLYLATLKSGRSDTRLLMIAICSLLLSLYNALISERPLTVLIPNMPFELMYKLKDFTAPLHFVMLGLLFYKLNKGIVSRRLLTFSSAFLLTVAVLVLVLPIKTYILLQGPTILWYQGLSAYLLVRTALLYIRSGEAERRELFLLFLALTCTNMYALNFLVYVLFPKGNLLVGQMYLVLHMVVLIFLVSMRFFEAYSTMIHVKDRLLSLDRMKDDFLGNTTQELKTPLGAMISIADALRNGSGGPVTEEQRTSLGIVLQSGQRLSNLIYDLQDYTRLKNGEIKLHKSAVDIKSLADSVLNVHSFLLGSKKIRLFNHIADGTPHVLADRRRLEQILHNLVGNAVKFTLRGHIAVNAVVKGSKVEIQVADTGIGIDPRLHDTIFRFFDQHHLPAAKRQEGTGLGLGITRRLVELHGGMIRVESERGRGSVFRFTLPAARTSSRSGADGSNGEWSLERSPHPLGALEQGASRRYPIRVEGTRKERILIVDDNLFILQSILHLVQMEGFAAVAVDSGQMALDEIRRSGDFHLVILDVMMPDMSGYHVLQQLRQRFSLFELPILMLTARDRGSEVVWSLEQGANDFAGKPVEPDELRTRVRSLVKLKEAMKAAQDAEHAFLRSQIKPHFLYNALNSIASLCTEEPERAEELTLELSQYLRSSFQFKGLDALAGIKQELELIQAYLHIEKARFGSRLKVEYDLCVDTGKMIPPLLLQPLVENAVRHGIMSRLEGGTVRISIQGESRGVRFEVEDDGMGMSPERIKQVLQSEGTGHGAGVGLWNINRRLRLLYGTSLQIDSAPGRGTKVFFCIDI